MFPSLALLAAFLSAVPSIANAYATPTSPDSTTVVKVGGEVTALWNADTTGEWTKMTIQVCWPHCYRLLKTLAHLFVMFRTHSLCVCNSFIHLVPNIYPHSHLFVFFSSLFYF